MIVKRARTAASVLLGRKPAGRSLTVLADDTYIVSYPRSGNTWTRFLIGNLLSRDHAVSFANVERKVPDIYGNTDEELLAIERPRVIKSHEYFDPRYRSVIYIVRDPRDIVLSYYRYHLKQRIIVESLPIERYVSSFISGELDPFGPWGENVGSWLGSRRYSERFLLLRYEDLLHRTEQELTKVAGFLSIRADSALVERAVRLSSAARMREMEREQAHLWKPIKTSRTDVPFVGAARSGQWKAELPEFCVAQIEAAWPEPMRELGYL